jgi:NAD(P)-dependent dehydrogenase (short-subunit alcohol dehydrogenase family)
MRIDLSGKTALVTGSTAGIGFAIAKGLAGSGAAVVINGRNAETVERALTMLKREVPGANARGFVGDLADAGVAAKLVKEHPRFDVLVNNLGIYGLRDFLELPDSEWQRFFEINVMSGVRLSRAYAPAMAERGWGRIVFISSESGLNIPSDMIHYGFTKTAQLSIARGLAKRLAGTGVTVNSVLPGPTATEGVAAMLKERVAKTGQTVEGGREGVRQGPPAVLDHPTRRERRGGGEHGRLCLLDASIGHDRCRVACRWRRRRHDRVARRHSSPRAISAALPPAAAVLIETARSTAKRET